MNVCALENPLFRPICLFKRGEKIHVQYTFSLVDVFFSGTKTPWVIFFTCFLFGVERERLMTMAKNSPFF